MFIQQMVGSESIEELARKDLVLFFNEHWLTKDRNPDLLQNAMAEIDRRKRETGGVSIDVTPANGVEVAMNYLETIAGYPLDPKVDVGDLNDVHMFLVSVQSWLDKFIPPSTRFADDSSAKAPRVDKFCELIGPSCLPAPRTGSVVVTPKIKGVEFSGSRSWLFVRANANHTTLMLYIDDELIQKSSKDMWLVELRYAIFKLHELGHARCDMDFYLASAPGVKSLPSHENRAWIYAHAVSSLVSSCRSRIDRLLLNDGLLLRGS